MDTWKISGMLINLVCVLANYSKVQDTQANLKITI